MNWVNYFWCLCLSTFFSITTVKGSYIDTTFADGPGHTPIQIRIRMPEMPTIDSLAVLYMLDGQNLFDSNLSFAGEWKIDETLDSLAVRNTMIVAIYNRGSERLSDYTPWSNAKYGGGKGNETILWMATILKPWVDGKFKVHRDAQKTGIIGSSLGGLMAIQAGVMFPDVFGRVGVFSPALWYSDSAFQILPQSKQERLKFKKLHHSQKWYFVAGDDESVEMVPLCKQWIRKFKQTGMAKNSIGVRFCKDGKHQEWFWAREFCSAYQFLF